MEKIENTKFREHEQFSENTKMVFSVFKNSNQTGPLFLPLLLLLCMFYFSYWLKENNKLCKCLCWCNYSKKILQSSKNKIFKYIQLSQSFGQLFHPTNVKHFLSYFELLYIRFFCMNFFFPKWFV